jgi:hypothetical protein
MRAKREVPKVGRSIILDCKIVDPQTTQQEVIYIVEVEGEVSLDKMTVFCFGFAASALVVGVMLLAALIWQG